MKKEGEGRENGREGGMVLCRREREEGREEERVRWERYEGRVKEKKKEHIEGTCHCNLEQ